MPDAALVNLPTPLSANGQIAGHISELTKPRRATQYSEVIPDVKTIPKVKSIPNIAQIFNAASYLIYLGIAMIPIMYPITMDIMVSPVKNFASDKGTPIALP